MEHCTHHHKSAFNLYCKSFAIPRTSRQHPITVLLDKFVKEQEATCFPLVDEDNVNRTNRMKLQRCLFQLKAFQAGFSAKEVFNPGHKHPIADFLHSVLRLVQTCDTAMCGNPNHYLVRPVEEIETKARKASELVADIDTGLDLVLFDQKETVKFMDAGLKPRNREKGVREAHRVINKHFQVRIDVVRNIVELMELDENPQIGYNIPFDVRDLTLDVAVNIDAVAWLHQQDAYRHFASRKYALKSNRKDCPLSNPMCVHWKTEHAVKRLIDKQKRHPHANINYFPFFSKQEWDLWKVMHVHAYRWARQEADDSPLRMILDSFREQYFQDNPIPFMHSTMRLSFYKLVYLWTRASYFHAQMRHRYFNITENIFGAAVFYGRM